VTPDSLSPREVLALGVGVAVMSLLTELAKHLDEREQRRRPATPGAAGTAAPTTSGPARRNAEHQALLADSVGPAPDGSRRE
jgi:hypothetical protein